MRAIADYPRLVAEWHRARNLPNTPASVDSHSYQPIWWKCLRKRSHTRIKRALGSGHMAGADALRVGTSLPST
ncbi:zinc-ribbon domain-containing protein [Pendulispora brunnea]|uniref:zinc-ribbon domain-containing protein n=1 Tax=Pendulispora brunnea TaxID=2905690 RepID=UPI00374E0E25